jgi:hypothetical protein
MIKIIILILGCFILNTGAYKPVSGGANCTNNTDCGGINAGTCTNKTCLCPNYLSNPTCNYQLTNKNLIIGLEFMYVIGLGGIGLFVIKQTFSAVLEFLAGLGLNAFIITLIFDRLVCPNRGSYRNANPIPGVLLFLWILGWIGVGMTIQGLFDGGTFTDANGYPLY